MKRFYTGFFILIAAVCLAAGTQYGQDVLFKNGGTMRGDIILTDGTRAASRAYVASVAGDLESLLQQGSLRLYYRTATDSVTGARILSATPEAGAGSTIAYAALSATTYTQVNTTGGGRVSETGIPGVSTLTAGVYTAVRYMSSDQAVSTGRSVTGANELWLVDADGSSNPVFVATSSEYTVIGTEKTTVSTNYVLNADVSTGGTTRRFLEKHYRKRTGVLTGANPAITVYYGGTSEGIFSAPLPSEVVMRTDAANAVAATARTNLDVYSKAETAGAIDADVATAQAAIDGHIASTGTAVHGLGTISTQAANNVSISGGSISGITDLAVADGGTGASTAGDARTNLGVVATQSLIDHEADQSTHGCTVIASTTLVTDHTGDSSDPHGATLTQTSLEVTNASFGGIINTNGNWISGDGGAEGIKVDGSGNVGIGCAPTYPLDIQTSGANILRLKGGSGVNGGGAFYVTEAGSANTLFAIGDEASITGGTPDQGARLYTGTNKPLSFFLNGAERMRIDSSGNVGIGTSTPQHPLHVKTGPVMVETAGDNYGFRAGEHSGTTGKQLLLGYFLTGDYGAIQSVHNGTAWKPLALNPSGGNVGIASASPDCSLVVGGYTRLGTIDDGAPKIKMKKLTGTTASVEASSTAILHGLTSSKILAVNVLVDIGSGEFVPPNFTNSAEYEYFYYVDGNNIGVYNSGSNSGNILSKGIKILVTYEE